MADSGNGALRRIAKDGAVTTLFGGSGPALRDGAAAFAALRQVSSMLVLPTHAVLLGDGSTIREYTPETGEVSTVLGSNSTTPAFSDGGPGSASMVGPLAFALAPDGTVAMTDAGANAIRVITSTGEVVTLAASASRNFAGLPTAGNSNAGFESSFFGPRGVAVAADGVVFVADTGNHALRSLALSTTGLTVATVAGDPFGQDCRVVATPTSCANARFGYVSAMAIRPNGDLVVLDIWDSTCNTYSNLRRSPLVRLIHNPESPQACMVSTVAGQASPLFNAVVPGALPAAFNAPAGLAIGPLQNFWLVDTMENAVLSLELPP